MAFLHLPICWRHLVVAEPVSFLDYVFARRPMKRRSLVNFFFPKHHNFIFSLPKNRRHGRHDSGKPRRYSAPFIQCGADGFAARAVLCTYILPMTAGYPSNTPKTKETVLPTEHLLLSFRMRIHRSSLCEFHALSRRLGLSLLVGHIWSYVSHVAFV